jgi:hypothetical protein
MQAGSADAEIDNSTTKQTQRVLPAVLTGVGGTKQVPVTSCDSRNVLETEEDPYWSESVLVRRARSGTPLHLFILLRQQRSQVQQWFSYTARVHACANFCHCF